MAHAGGRPTKYNDDILIKTQQYFERNVGVGSGSLPTLEGLSLELGIDDETIIEWAKIHPEFSAAIKRIKAAQKQVLMNDGMYGGKEVNATMAIFLLKANHGMIETDRKLLGGLDGGDLVIKTITYADDDKDST